MVCNTKTNDIKTIRDIALLARAIIVIYVVVNCSPPLDLVMPVRIKIPRKSWMLPAL
jgi:hypothetical protein